MKKQIGVLVLGCFAFFAIQAEGEKSDRSRAVRLKQRKEMRAGIRAELDHQYKKNRIRDVIADAHQEGTALERQALSTAWTERMQERFLRERAHGRYAHVYPAPTAPLAMQQFFGTHSIAADYAYRYIGNGFDETGTIVDSSVVRFGKTPLFSDIVLASKYALTPDTTISPGYEFLSDLNPQAIPFQVSIATHECALGYTFGLMQNRFQLGVRVPFQKQTRSLSVVSDLTPAVQALLHDRSEDTIGGLLQGIVRNEIFRDYYGISVADLMVDMIEQKNMKYRDSLGRTCVGEVSFFAAVNFFPWRLERWTLAVECTVPGDKNVDTDYFYPIFPDNDGYTSVKLHTAFVAKKTGLGNPYLHATGQVFFPQTLTRRVPRMIISDTLVTTLPSTEAFGADVVFDPARTLNTPETTIADFASDVTRVALRPGFAVDLRVGSVLRPFNSPLFQADVYYHAHLRAADEMRAGLSADTWYADALLSPLYRTQHTIGCSVTYEPTPHFLMRAGLSGVVGGRNMPLAVTVFFGISGSV